MASPGHEHCANCIGTLSFPMGVKSDIQRRPDHRFCRLRRLSDDDDDKLYIG